MISSKLLRLTLVLSLFAVIIVIGNYWRNPAYYPLVVVDATDNLTLTFLQQPTSDRNACAVLATTIASLMHANCPTCKVTKQDCLEELPPDQQVLFSEKPIAMPSAHLLNGIIVYAHPNQGTALAACMESQRHAAASSQVVQVICNPAGTSRPFPQERNRIPEATRAAFRYLGLSVAVLGAVIALLLTVQLFSARSPTDTDAVGVTLTSPIDWKLTNRIKRIADILIAIALLCLLFPILLLVAVLIFILEGPPIFYLSRRFISLEQCVSIFKFRTMVKDATSPKYRLRERFMREGYLDIPLDCEVYTSIGRLLERTQLVETLQLFNVFLHGMSLIGNRPLPRENVELLKNFSGWEQRFECPAGLTGISQVVGKLNQTPAQRLELECLYASVYKSPSGNILLCDIFIFYHTLRYVLFGKPLSFEGAKRLLVTALGNKIE